MRTGIQMINREPSYPRSEALVKPELAPPVHSNEVTEPLVSKLVGHDVCNTIPVAVCGGLWVEEYCGGPTYGLGLVNRYEQYG